MSRIVVLLNYCEIGLNRSLVSRTDADIQEAIQDLTILANNISEVSLSIPQSANISTLCQYSPLYDLCNVIGAR